MLSDPAHHGLFTQQFGCDTRDSPVRQV